MLNFAVLDLPEAISLMLGRACTKVQPVPLALNSYLPCSMYVVLGANSSNIYPLHHPFVIPDRGWLFKSQAVILACSQWSC